MSNINFGIDLGTTNSAIAKYQNGKVTIYKNPVGFKDTLPSVVSFRKGRIQIGDKARERIVLDATAVFSSFKRKMGTEETYYVEDLKEHVSPKDLSAKVLSELKNFVTDENLETAVITIPASFDTIQSNATKKAGYAAGIREVVLLQEPIAACLAYSNENNLELQEEKKWLVYDFGGGTFDAALININHRELKIIDHKGNNFLGGLDIDHLLVEKLICPKLEVELGETELWKKMTTAKEPSYTKLFLELLFKAEELKKELSVKTTASIEIDSIDLDIFLDITINREDLDKVLLPKFEESYMLLQELLSANSLKFSDIERVILVGGTTYIPFIREELRRRSNIEIDSSIDPTTAVVIGAAYYAGNKISELEEETNPTPEETTQAKVSLEVDWIYENSTQDEEELITGIVQGGLSGLYRIIRMDGGFDTGMNAFKDRISEFTPLLSKASNHFKVSIFNQNEELLYTNNTIKITNGLYNVNGQPLPNDICIELDDAEGKSILEPIFTKNQILPLKKTIYKTSSKTILKNTEDNLIINVLEGHGGNLPASNLSIGYIELSGKDFQMDLLKGMEVELEFEMSESRDLKIGVYISSLDLEINEVFNPSELKVSLPKIKEELKYVLEEVMEEQGYYEDGENYEYLSKLQYFAEELKELLIEAIDLEDDNATGRKYQLNEKKRKLIQEYDNLTKSKLILKEIFLYKDAKDTLESYMDKATEPQQISFKKIIKNEKEVLESGNKYLLQRKTKEIEKLTNDIYSNQDEAYLDYFLYFRLQDEEAYLDPNKFNTLVEMGEKAMAAENMRSLKSICNQLYHLLKTKPNFGDDDMIDGNLGLK